MSVVEMGGLSDFVICVFLVLKCRYESVGIAARSFIIL